VTILVTTPYILSGTIYDVDGAIPLTDATIKVTNKRLNETTFTASDSNGEYVIDLANYTGYRNGDLILIESFILGDVSKKYKSATITVDTSIGYTSQDLTLDAIIEDISVSTRKDDILQRSFDFITNSFKNKIINSLDIKSFPSALLEENNTVLRTENYYSLIAEDKVNGHSRGSVIGTNEGIGATAFVILSNETVTQPSANVQMQAVSTSEEDTDGGTGANQVTIKYLPKAWSTEYSTETITLDGTTPVNTVATDIYRIEEFYVNKASGLKLSIGEITLKSTDAVTLYAQINIGRNFFERAIHYVRTGYKAVITDIILGCSTNGGVIWRAFRSWEDADGNVVPRGRLSVEVADNTMSHPWNIPVVCSNPNGKRMAMGLAVKGRVANQIGTASFRYYDEL